MSLNIARKNTPYLYDLNREANQILKKRLIGVSHWAKKARQAVLIHSEHDRPVLLEGERGTGKEFIARLIHQFSPRSQSPFFAVICDSASDESFEAALFGSVNKLPSDRFYTNKGLIEKAAGGTLYIECGSKLASVLKDKIARLIVYGNYYRVGENVPESAETRVILGVPPQLKSQSESSGAHSLPINDRLPIPPLRERKQDLESLINHFLSSFCQKNGKEQRTLSPDTFHLLHQYEWPGNTGELKRVTESMVQKAKPPAIVPSLLPAHIANQPGFNGCSIPDWGIDLNEERERFEMRLLSEALKKCRGKQSEAAKLLGLKRTTLHTKIKHYGIQVEFFRDSRD